MENQSLTTTSSQSSFFSLINHPLKLRLYLLKNLPAAFFSGVRVVEANERTCVTSVPYRWLTQNPFRSTYFASLSMAAELSTGVLAMAQIYGRQPAVSMLITGMEARFHKKAKEVVAFTCADGEQIRDAIAVSRATGEPQNLKAHSVGRNRSGDVIAEFWFTWSFKVR